jgi:hypothetical protein
VTSVPSPGRMRRILHIQVSTPQLWDLCLEFLLVPLYILSSLPWCGWGPGRCPTLVSCPLHWREVAKAESPLRAILHLSPVTSQQAVDRRPWLPVLEELWSLWVPAFSSTLREELTAPSILNDWKQGVKSRVRAQAQCFLGL